MKISKTAFTYKGRYLGILFLVIVQFLVGFIHIIFGLAMLLNNFSVVPYSITPTLYSTYTLIYGSLTVFFTYFVWKGQCLGWVGTVAISSFVIIADTLTVFNLLNVLGIPKAAPIGEIPFSTLIIIYLLQHHVRSEYNI